jgi:hypothetical protein
MKYFSSLNLVSHFEQTIEKTTLRVLECSMLIADANLTSKLEQEKKSFK